MPDSLASSIQSLTSSPVVAAVASNIGTTVASGDGVVMGLASLLNVIAQRLKQETWFHQNEWMIPTLLGLGLALSFLLIEDWRQAVLKAGMAVWQSLINYGGLGPKGLALLKEGTD